MNMALIKFIFLLAFLMYSGCDSNDPFTLMDSDEMTLNNKSKGFSFSAGKTIPITDTSNVSTDFRVYANRIGNTIVGVNLSSPDTTRTYFNLIKEFTQSDSAQNFFYNLKAVPDSNYTDFSVSIKENQIWSIKTREDKYAKILVIHTFARIDTTSTPGILFFYAEIKFKWRYLSNGSRYF